MAQLRDDLEHHIVTWAEVHRDTRILVRRLMPKGPWKGIVALTRGGDRRPGNVDPRRRHIMYLQL